jgi:N-acetylglucosaminyldiphosphoundecaprenol N-acetyl-beta-D-mannosaminyltransferase
MRAPFWVWGLPLAPLTRLEAADAVMDLVAAGRPSYFITANTHYAMVTQQNPQLRAVNEQAAFVLADGAPLVWASRWQKTPLPERVAGSDLIFDLCERAARRGHSLFFLGGAEGVAEEAARRLCQRYAGLCVAGTESPPFRNLAPDEHERLLDRIRAARPDILVLASTMPKGEQWVAANHAVLNVPVCVNLGASLDFVAGWVQRAPYRLQHLGLEWAYRMWLEPGRLAPRYARNAGFALGMMSKNMAQGLLGQIPANPSPPMVGPDSYMSGNVES